MMVTNTLHDHNAPRALAALTSVFATLAQAGCADMVAFGLGVAELERGRLPSLVHLWARHGAPDIGTALTALTNTPGIHAHRATGQVVRNNQPRLLLLMNGYDVALELYAAIDDHILDHLAQRTMLGEHQIALAPNGRARVSGKYLASLR